MSDRLDMTVTRTVHNALRRELRHLAHAVAHHRPAARPDLRSAPGWHLFITALHVHQSAEDDALWPPLRRALAGRPLDLTRVEAIEAEHRALSALVDSITEVRTDTEAGPGLLLDLTASLITGLDGHLDHEESAVLPLAQALLTQDQWDDFERAHAHRIGSAAPRLMPWLLHGLDDRTITALLAQLFPRFTRHTYTHHWQPAFARLDLWGTRGEIPAALRT
ncbi:hemerythrin domain-containing protein [Kitasatospora sp. NPDC085895]|uniref:hemerythrin domain-containing protein n=1 Tax=Kitasatospora sp. NPDC085895 TaxID=3155057 RepID=UPI00344D9CE3